MLSQRQKTEAGNIEGEADRGVDVESEEDDLVDSKSSHTEQTFLLGYVLMSLTVLIVWIDKLEFIKTLIILTSISW